MSRWPKEKPTDRIDTPIITLDKDESVLLLEHKLKRSEERLRIARDQNAADIQTVRIRDEQLAAKDEEIVRLRRNINDDARVIHLRTELEHLQEHCREHIQMIQDLEDDLAEARRQLKELASVTTEFNHEFDERTKLLQQNASLAAKLKIATDALDWISVVSDAIPFSDEGSQEATRTMKEMRAKAKVALAAIQEPK